MEMHPSSDREHISDLIRLASDVSQLQEAQRNAAWKLLKFDGEIYPLDGCAITLSILLQEAGISIKDTFQAFALGNLLKSERNWKTVEVGQQKNGDVGSTCRSQPIHGEDHIYLVLRALNPDEMVVADNQAVEPHLRYASGKGGKTPTRFFLRAPE
jgi:hypothetical protein